MRVIRNKITFAFNHGEFEKQVLPYVEYLKANNYHVDKNSEITPLFDEEEEFSITYDFVVNNNVERQESEQEFMELRKKAAKWDHLNKVISEFYCDSTGKYNTENPIRKGDLGDIGELSAALCGWL